VSRSARFSERFPCTPTGARRARKRVTQFAADWLSGDDLLHFEMACGEALANCVEHADSPTMMVECWSDNDRLMTEIRHDGEGFVPPECVEAPPPGAPRGYGLFIIHSVLDGVEFLDRGRGLRLIKSTRPRRA
jgi:anti-sigma regulatory factor (Ser/Thr protein kinase)